MGLEKVDPGMVAPEQPLRSKKKDTQKAGPWGVFLCFNGALYFVLSICWKVTGT